MTPAPPLRILATVPLYPPGSRVGAWLATHEYLRFMAARGHQVDVITYQGTDWPYELDGVTVHPSKTRIRDMVTTADVVVSHLGDMGQGHNEAKAAGKPSVRFVHGPVPNPSDRLRGADLVVFNSRASQVPTDAPSIICRPHTDPTAHQAIPGDRVTCVNLSERKGGDVFWSVAAAMPDTLFLGVLGGYGEQIQGDLPNVEVVMPTRDMRTVWARTRLLLVPSIAESWGMVGIEAMTNGIPVVAHPSAGLCESLGSAAIWARRAHTGEWVEQIRRLAHPGAYRTASLVAKGRADAVCSADDRPRFAGAVEALVAQ